MKLWETEETEISEKVEEFTQDDKELEQKLLKYDILGNLAHVQMLESQGFLLEKELSEIKEILTQLLEDQPEVQGEDVHTFVEKKVCEKTDAGLKMHTGRSRNDQVVLDTRLYMKTELIETAVLGLEIVEELEALAENKNKLIPGYTHQQQAMPSSTGLWASSFADAMADDLKILKSTYKVLDQNPLGGAASYGTSLKIDRKETKKLLGFGSIQENPINAVGNRGKPELLLVQSLDHIMIDLQKIAEDMINYSEDQEIFDLPEEMCTGSSIMPQKQNPDVLELLRAKAEEVNASSKAIRGIISKLPSGYNRDSQATKKHMIEALETTQKCLEILKVFLSKTEISDNYEIQDSIFAAHTANQKVKDGKSFREAYKEVKKEQEYTENNEVPPPKNQSTEKINEFWQAEKQKMEEIEEDLIA